MRVRLFLLLLIIFVGLASHSTVIAEEAEKEQIIPRAMIQHTLSDGVKFLFSAQQPDGFWYYNETSFPVGTTSLVIYSLALSGISPKDKHIAFALEVLLEKIKKLDVENTTTYELGLAKMALELVGRKQYRQEIVKLKSILLNRQAQSGGWDYKRPAYTNGEKGQEQRTDWSNTQFAVLGLSASERTEAKGYAYKNRTAPFHWMNLRKYIMSTFVSKDNGWPYCPVTDKPENLRASVSMTCAGIASSLITYAALNHSKQYPCGSDKELLNKIQEGIDYFDKDPKKMTSVIPKTIKEFTQGYTYKMYAMERVGFYTGLRKIGDMDWFQAGAKSITECNRNGANGGWKGVPGAALTLLFLSKGRWPVAVQKLKWGEGWNDDALDMLRLTEKASETFEEKELDRVFESDTKYLPTPRAGKRCTWQTLTFDTPFEKWLEVPILYIVGKKFPEFSKSQIHMLKKYAYSGGTILAVAGCGSDEFDEGFRKFTTSAFEGLDMVPLDRKHELFSSWFKANAAYDTLEGIVGPHGRMMVLYSPEGISCDWESGRVDSKEAKMGISIIKYVTDSVPDFWQ